MELLVDVIELVAIVPGAVGEIDFRRAVAVDAPAHAQVGELSDLVHLLDGAVAGLALHLPYPYMLGMVEIDKIGEVVDLDPFDGSAGARIFSLIRVIAGVAV